MIGFSVKNLPNGEVWKLRTWTFEEITCEKLDISIAAFLQNHDGPMEVVDIKYNHGIAPNGVDDVFITFSAMLIFYELAEKRESKYKSQALDLIGVEKE
ncbi:hypothetical protein [Tumebacillus flagellatus]|uniref:Uncharacterized protein n=1 Tax=Tumebacillus flagellatus TaxID=1157490 RepID=A0A074LLQ0_9BACL|nr:hypothetical protein [Tumebacillus flagellatus]KEO80808.1 hypothetical protein EL26_24300 [Tumebacillus flagellatus]